MEEKVAAEDWEAAAAVEALVEVLDLETTKVPVLDHHNCFFSIFLLLPFYHDLYKLIKFLKKYCLYIRCIALILQFI